jgi:iron(III) transport system substrate-binding protein
MNHYLHHRMGTALALSFLLLLTACVSDQQGKNGNGGARGAANEVTIYVSTDRVFSEPILRAYEQKTGAKVNAVYDTEETKSTGLANRLLAEKNNPQADVFWSNEPVRTLVLKQRGVLAPYVSPSAEGIPDTLKDRDGYWTGFSSRMRVIVYNTNLVKAEEAPKSVLDLADPKWKGQAAIADPRFGSTSFHVAALYAELGDENCARQLCRPRYGGSRRGESGTHRHR